MLNPILIDKQIDDMAVFQPHFVCSRPAGNNITIANNTVEWVGEVQPTALSVKYTVKINYEFKRPPEVTVLSPELKLAEGKRHLPHFYKEGYLCLYTPKRGEWDVGRSIAATIVPWISLWLYYYEVWLITGDWMGDGTEPSADERI